MKTIAIFVCGTLTALPLFAAQLEPLIHKRHLGFSLINVEWPRTLAKDFQSGFENRILIRLTLTSDSMPTTQSDVMVTEKYDLWNELYTVKLFVGNKLKTSKDFSRLSEAVSYATALQFTDVFVLADAAQNNALILQANILVNPVEREKIENVAQWVAENSTSKKPISAGGNAPLTARPNSLFNSIYGQYVRGADMAAPWKIEIISKPFVMATYKNDAHSNEDK